jgi:hypothetical protein
MRKRTKVKKKPIIILFLLVLVIGGGLYFVNYLNNKKKTETRYLASSDLKITLKDEEGKDAKDVVRGIKVDYYINQDNDNTAKIKLDNNEYYLDKNYLVKELKDTVLEKEIYVRTSYNINKDLDSTDLLTLAKKGDKLEVIGFDKLDKDGRVNMYKVKYNDTEGYFYEKYTEKTEELAKVNYDYNGAYETHKKQKDVYGGGNGASLDYFPVEKPKFENNKMPDECYTLYLNGTKGVMNMVDDYIKFAKTTKINAFVIDVIDDVNIGYVSPYMEKECPTCNKHAQNTLDNYKKAVAKLKENGFYVIGRITAFKNTYYVSDHKADAITNSSGTPLLHQSSYWPSAFNRNVWKFDVELAKEAVNLIGFNEIQYDYVRFPDGLNAKEKAGSVKYNNTYKETKAEAVQRFLMYATNELHKLNVYVSADVFGESSYGSGYITSYGQYWPAITTVVDVISAMPYTDHFGYNYGGHPEPWVYPYDTVNTWAKTAAKGQKLSASPAIARTWITAYNTPVAASGTSVSYNGPEVSAQIKALYDNGLTGGYMTWNAFSYQHNLEKYQRQKDAYTKEYKK